MVAGSMKLGPYELGPKIGGGGMATVYVGRNDDSDVAAIKVIRDELARDTEYIHMFLDEAKVLSSLAHEDIIVTKDFGVTDDARFIAMELLLGRSLIDVFERCAEAGKRVPMDLAAYIVLRVASALEHAHGKQVIHRDVNPTNIFLTYDGRVKLIDFGLAKSVGRIAKSAEGVVKGKVPYLSPEQIEEKPIDARTDLYSLGATLWELTTGRRLFKRATDVETIRAIREHAIPDPRTFVDGLYPDALWAIIERALQPEPAARYSNAAAMATDLRAFIDKHGRKGNTAALIASWLEELFPGECAKQEAWLAQVSVPATTKTTLVPPAPVAEVPSSPPSSSPTAAVAAPAPRTPAAPAPARKHPMHALAAAGATALFFAVLALIFGRC
jgi:eukaryotic-like serine/threonine-protein kinase